MKKFEILEHKADLKIRVFGKNKEELFRNAVLAMMSILKAEPDKPVVAEWDDRPILQQKVKVNSPDLSALLVDFLNEVLYLTQVNKEVYSEVKFTKFSDTAIEAKLLGKKVESFGEDIKAVTYHGLDIRQTDKEAWQATVLFDI